MKRSMDTTRRAGTSANTSKLGQLKVKRQRLRRTWFSPSSRSDTTLRDTECEQGDTTRHQYSAHPIDPPILILLMFVTRDDQNPGDDRDDGKSCEDVKKMSPSATTLRRYGSTNDRTCRRAHRIPHGQDSEGDGPYGFGTKGDSDGTEAGRGGYARS